MAAQPKDSARYTEVRNPKALRDFFIHDKFEAGIKLAGSEVKSIRLGKAQLADAFARLDKGEVWLYGAYIEEYSYAGLSQHTPRRPRKLLLHASEIRKLQQQVETGGRLPDRCRFDAGDCEEAAEQFGVGGYEAQRTDRHGLGLPAH